MNAGNAFRSHLMQQFASAARHQSRPPLAMMPWILGGGGGGLDAADVDNNSNNTINREDSATAVNKKQTLTEGRPGRTFSSSKQQQHRSSWALSSCGDSESHHPHMTTCTTRRPSGSCCVGSSVSRLQHIATARTKAPHTALRSSFSSVAAPRDNSDHPNENHPNKIASIVLQDEEFRAISEDTNHDDNNANHFDAPSRQAQQFQTLLQTRRTTSHFAPPRFNDADTIFWNQALDRAVACARRAPNHKRTEAFSFKRMIAPSPATQQLADIAYYVTLRKSQSEQQAEKKRTKWSQVPAFLVAMVHTGHHLLLQNQEQDHDKKPMIEEDSDSSSLGDLCDPLPFIPLKTEREMEDYASACAAVQNVLLSLHAEEIASKWATGPVIQTNAFRKLVGATSPDDRVVALIMIGWPLHHHNSIHSHHHADDDNHVGDIPVRQRRFRRDWNDFLQDL